MAKFSICDAATYLYASITMIILNNYIIANMGERYLAVFVVLGNLSTLVVMGFDGVGQAIQPIINVYFGENNIKGTKKVMLVAFKTAIIEALIIFVLLVVFANYIPFVFGIDDATLTSYIAKAVRIFACSVVFSSIIMLYTSYYVYIDRIVIALIINTFSKLIFINVGVITLGIWFADEKIWFAYALGEVLTIIAGMLLLKMNAKGTTLPLLLDKKTDSNLYSYDFYLTQDKVMDLRDTVESLLRGKGYDKFIVNRTMLTIEEHGMLMVEKNSNKKKKIIAELTVDLNEGVTLIFRDTAKKYNTTDGDEAVSSLTNFTSLMILSQINKSSYLLATGDNRTLHKIA